MTELDAAITKSLTSFTKDVFDKERWGEEGWPGMEREAVSLFAFGHLVPQCKAGRILFDPAQIGIEVRVLQPGVLPKKPKGPYSKKTDRICKDLIVWREPETTWQDGVHPLAVMEWKTNQAQVSVSDVQWLKKLSKECPEFTGYAVCLNMKKDRTFRLSCTRVKGGDPDPNWLVIPTKRS
jgi:hypothetical protein